MVFINVILIRTESALAAADSDLSAFGRESAEQGIGRTGKSIKILLTFKMSRIIQSIHNSIHILAFHRIKTHRNYVFVD